MFRGGSLWNTEVRDAWERRCQGNPRLLRIGEAWPTDGPPSRLGGHKFPIGVSRYHPWAPVLYDDADHLCTRSVSSGE